MIRELMGSRRSIRRFRAEMPSRELIEGVVRAAVTAPSASNQQPWRFLALTDRAAIATLASAVRAAVGRILQHVEERFRPPLLAYGENFARFEAAPIVLVALWRPFRLLSHVAGDAMPAACVERIDDLERGSGLVSASLALGHLLLAAHAAGLGACCMTGPLLASDETRDLLRIPPSWRVAAFVPLGFPDETPPPTPRKPVEQILTWITDERTTHGT
jgi:nitroreductase